MKDNPIIVFFGAGSVGASIGAWTAAHHKNTYFLDVGKVAKRLERTGITHYKGDQRNRKENIKVNVIKDLSEIPTPDIIAVAVKNYSLDAVSKLIKDKTGDKPVIIGMQNGIENQKILPRYFSKIIYCVICFNAWLDRSGVVGYQKKGPLVLGTVNNELQFEMAFIRNLFNKGVETVVTMHLNSAVHSKMIINLTNSLTTLAGHTYRKISDQRLFQKLLANLTYEGVKIVKAAGYDECKLGDMPSWRLIQASARLPQFITKIPFKKNVKKMVISSMAQDILQRGACESELETLNGYFIDLAEKHNIEIPYNKTIYNLCKDEFSKSDFKPWDVKDIWAKVEQNILQN
ncbi:MAG: ketopantoate reductase family protein [Desulfobacteraceae bacterium]|nr:ketopantoate reductase family protein [Desulfobacteraceae bacterium]